MRIPRQTQVGAEHPRRLFSPREDRIHHRQVEVTNIDVAAEIAPPLRIGNLHLSVKLTVVGQADQPSQFRTIVTQVSVHIQGVERHRQRRVIDLLRHLHVTPGEGNAALRQSLFSGVPRDVRFTAEDPAGLGGFRHKRFQHRQVKTVEVDLRASFRARINGLRHAQLSIRVGPAVWPNADLLLRIAVVQRDGSGQHQRADRRAEAGVIQHALPARCLAVKTARQVHLPGDRLALHAQLEIVLLFVTFCRQRDQTDVHVRLRDTLHAQIQVSADLIGGFHVPLDAYAGNRKFLPAQVIGGDVRQQLRRLHCTANLH